MASLSNFSFNLSWMLEASGKSKTWLSQRFGVSQPTVSDWCSGKKAPSLEHLKRICEIMDLRADFLLGLSETNYPAIFIWDNRGFPVYRDLDFNQAGMTEARKNMYIFHPIYTDTLDELNDFIKIKY